MASEKAKFLGKLYIDRYMDQPIDQGVVQRAVRIIQEQAPKKNKAKVQFISIPGGVSPYGYSQPATLMSINIKSGISLSKTPIVNILSVGRVKSVAYFLSLGADNGEIQRYWVRAFACRNTTAARALIRHILDLSTAAQPGFTSKTTGTKLSLLSATSSLGSADSGLTVSSASDVDEADPRRVPFAPINIKHPYTVRKDMVAHRVNESPVDEADAEREMALLTLGNLDDYVRVVDV